MEYPVEIYTASQPDKGIVGWRVQAATVEEAVAMYEQIKTIGNAAPMPAPVPTQSTQPQSPPVSMAIPKCPTHPDRDMKYKEGVSKKTGKPYKMFKCNKFLGPGDFCQEMQWVDSKKVNEGKNPYDNAPVFDEEGNVIPF